MQYSNKIKYFLNYSGSSCLNLPMRTKFFQPWRNCANSPLSSEYTSPLLTNIPNINLLLTSQPFEKKNDLPKVGPPSTLTQPLISSYNTRIICLLVYKIANNIRIMINSKKRSSHTLSSLSRAYPARRLPWPSFPRLFPSFTDFHRSCQAYPKLQSLPNVLRASPDRQSDIIIDLTNCYNYKLLYNFTLMHVRVQN